MNTFNYNSSQINYYTTVDLGYIGDTPSITVDNGETAYDLIVTGDYIVETEFIVNDFTEVDYDEINFSETTYPFGSIKIVSTTNSSASVVFVSKPEPIKLYEKAIVVRKQAWTGSGTLFEIGNGQEAMVAPWVGSSGPLRIFGSAASSRLHNFTEDSIVTYGSSTDYGSVNTAIGSSVDQGQIDSNASGGEVDYGDIIFDNVLPYGLYKISGFNSTDVRIKAWKGSGIYNISGKANVQFSEPIPQIYIVNGFGSIKTYNSIIPESFSRSSYIGSGSLFNIGSKIEKSVYVYAGVQQLADSVNQNNYGYVSNTTSTTVDFGNIYSPSSGGELDYGELFAQTNKFGSLRFNGSASVLQTDHYTGNLHIEQIPGNLYNIPSTIKISGAVTVQFIEPPNQFYVIDNRTLFIVSGGYSDLAFAKGNYNGSGSLFRIGEKIEKAVFSYNSSSVIDTQLPVDNGFVDELTINTVDTGSITESASEEISYGNIVIGNDVPYGLFGFSGTLIETVVGSVEANKEKFGFTVSGGYSDLAFISQAGESTALFRTKGGDSDSVTKPFIGSGSLFHIGDRTEKATYSYNTSSIVSIEDPVDYGNLSTYTSSIDYGSVGILNYGNINLGNIILTEGDENPFGLFTISGNAEYEFFPTYAWRGRGVIKIKEETPEAPNAAIRFRPWWRGRGGVDIYNSIIPDAIVKVFTGSGSLFHIGDKLESVTYDYNESSIVEYNPSIDYGLIENINTSSIDYGLIQNIVDEGELDLGSIIISDITYPLTGLFNFSGEAFSQFIRGPYNAKDGIITIYKGKSLPTDQRFMPWWRGYGELILSANTETPRSRTFIGSGSLFHIGDRVEKATYSYNNSSVEIFETIEDLGNIGIPTTSVTDYGSVQSIADGGEVDYGTIITTDTNRPYGLFNISGASVDNWIQVFTKVGSGSLFSFNGLVESTTSNPPENTSLYVFSGTKTEKFGKGLYTGSGSLFHIGDRIERATFFYNTSSIRESFDSSDNGYVNSVATSNTDLGFVSEPYYENTNYGYINDQIGTENPFGLFNISGAAIEPAKLANWVGTGSLFAISNTAEAFSAQTPENTFLYTFSGSAAEKHVERYIGEGNIKIKEETPLAPNAAVRFRPWWRSYGEINISGSASEEFRGAYVGGLRTNFRIYTAAEGFEWRSYRPSPRYVNSVYGNIGGSAFYRGSSVTKKINVYGYYGNLKKPGTSGSLFGIGGSAQTVTFSEVSTGLFSFSGTSPSKWNPSWTSRPDGSPRLSGTPGLQLRFNLFGNVDPTDNFKVSGTPKLKFIKIYTGSGSLFSFESATETIGFNPDLETGLFAINGAGKTNFSLLNIGSGSLFAVGSGAESSVVNPEENTVLYRFSGSGTEKQSVTEIGSGSTSIDVSHEVLVTRGYTGEGSLFGIGGDVDSVTQTESGSIALFSIGGSASDNFTRISSATKAEITIDVVGDETSTKTFIGSGTLFNIGSLEERVTFSTTSTVLFKISGLATNIQFSRDFIGSGSLFAVGSGAESTVANPEENIVLYKFSGRAVEKQTDKYLSKGVFEFISGIAEESSSKSFVGKGSLFSVNGSTEIKVSNPPENTILYRIEGKATIKSVNRHIGSGSEFISGNVDDSVTKVFTGSGSLFAIGNSAESKTVVLKSNQLFRLSGSTKQSFSKGNYSGSGSTSVSGFATNIKTTRSIKVFGYQSVTGNLTEKQTDSYKGSGSLFAFKNASIARSIDINTTKPGAQGDIISTNLFRISGRGKTSVTRITETETIEFNIYGESRSIVKLFSPIRIFGTII